MELIVSQKAKQGIFEQPRHLTPSEIASLRRDAISTSMEMKAILRERQSRQKWSVGRLLKNPPVYREAAE